MGIYLIVMSASLVASVRMPATMLLLALLLMFMPAVLYLLLRRMYREQPANRSFPAVWTAGIVTTLCGTLICGIVTAAWLLLVQPDFFAQYLHSAIAMVEQSGQEAEYAEQVGMMRRALDEGVVPSPMRFVFSMMWATVFFGSILSMLCAWLLRMRAFSVLNPDK